MSNGNYHRIELFYDINQKTENDQDYNPYCHEYMKNNIICNFLPDYENVIAEIVLKLQLLFGGDDDILYTYVPSYDEKYIHDIDIVYQNNLSKLIKESLLEHRCVFDKIFAKMIECQHNEQYFNIFVNTVIGFEGNTLIEDKIQLIKWNNSKFPFDIDPKIVPLSYRIAIRK